MNDVRIFDSKTFSWGDALDFGNSTPPSPRGASSGARLGGAIYFYGGYDQTGKYFELIGRYAETNIDSLKGGFLTTCSE